MNSLSRREFGAVLATTIPTAATPTMRLSKGICSINFPKSMPLSEAFLQAKNAGFDGIEIPVGGSEITMNSTPEQLKRTADAAQRARITVVSLWVSEPLSATPLNHPDLAVRAKGVETIRKCLEFAQQLNCGALLLIPGRVGSGPRFICGYQDTWDRVSGEMKKVVPMAERAKVVVTPENVWNRFLLSPLEMRAFVDQFKSPWLQAHFDIGNVMQFGYPQDWVLTLGPRIKRVHAKDFKVSTNQFVDLLEGDVNWKETMAALGKVGYRGYISPEYGYDPNDTAQLQKISKALDKILAM